VKIPHGSATVSGDEEHKQTTGPMDWEGDAAKMIRKSGYLMIVYSYYASGLRGN